ncbi:MAG: TetR/AcrR family transcriptional regulator [Leifsonia sp.]
MEEEGKPGLRERTRRAVAQEITETANALFIERGYETTTIDDIAEAVGMSRRSVFRYFATKEDLVLGKLGFLAEELLEAFRTRPADEPVWDSLRAVFDLLVPHVDALDKNAVAAPMQRVIFTTPSLLAAYLGMQQAMQDAIVSAVGERATRRGVPFGEGDPTPRAVTAAAFGCLVAAQRAWLEQDERGTFAAALDRAMDAVEPTTPG